MAELVNFSKQSTKEMIHRAMHKLVGLFQFYDFIFGSVLHRKLRFRFFLVSVLREICAKPTIKLQT